MFPALQPSRPKLPSPSQTQAPPPPPPLRQQTRRASSAHAPGEPSRAASTTPQPQNQHRTQPPRPPPRSQIEAMPPFPSAAHTPPPPPPHPTFAPPPGMLLTQQPILQPRLLHTPITQHYDSAVRHPVFFSSALRRPPFPLPAAASGGLNPVAHGYVVEDGRGGGGGGGGEGRRMGAVRGKL